MMEVAQHATFYPAVGALVKTDSVPNFASRSIRL
jgi:hypothetical protein